jgi:hypothetical protein
LDGCPPVENNPGLPDYGVTWQIVPSVLGQLMSDPDPAKAQRVMQAMLRAKLDIRPVAGARHDPDRPRPGACA